MIRMTSLRRPIQAGLIAAFASHGLPVPITARQAVSAQR